MVDINIFKNLILKVIKRDFDNDIVVSKEALLTFARTLSYMYDEFENYKQSDTDLHYKLLMTFGRILSEELEVDENDSTFTVLKKFVIRILEDLNKSELVPEDFSDLIKSNGEVYDSLDYESEFTVYTNYAHGYQILEAMYNDPVITKMDAKQLTRIAHWIDFQDDVKYIDNGDKIFVHNINEPIEDVDREEYNCEEPPTDKDWIIINLVDLLNSTTLSDWYVQVYDDSHCWISLVEIGNNDDYQP